MRRAQAVIAVASLVAPFAKVFRKRGYWHTLMAAVVGCWIVAAAVTLAVSDRWWSQVHVVTLGVLSNAIIAYSTHFAQALTRSKVRPYRSAAVKMLLISAALGIIMGQGVQLPWSSWVTAAALAVVIVALWHAVTVVRLWAPRSGPPLSITVVFYIVAAVALALAVLLVIAGYTLGLNVSLIVAAHSRLALWGFAWTTILGTIITMLPMLTRTKYSERARAWCLRALLLHGAALALGTVACVAGGSRIAGAGFLLVAAAGVGVIWPVIASALQAPNRADWDTASVGTCTALLWIIALIICDAIALMCGVSPRTSFRNILPALLGVGVVQLILSVLLFLLPAMIGRGPNAVRVGRSVAEFAGPARFTILNYGGGLIVLSLWNPIAFFPGILLMILGALGHVIALIVAAARQYSAPRKHATK